jgi:hypothetical protein
MKKTAWGLKERLTGDSGVVLLGAVILVSVVVALLLVIVTLVILGLNVSKQRVRQLSALDVAEAGVNYYLWHLVHAPGDYCDGNSCSGNPPYGPYVHNFTDNTGNVIGTYTLWIASPGITEGGKVVLCHRVPPTPHNITVAPSAVKAHLDQGDTIGSCEGGGGGSNSNEVVVESKGNVVGGNENRTILATLGIPSFARYAVVANDTTNNIRFGVGTEVWGPIHNNGGVRFDGVAHALVTSALATYRDTDTGLTEPGVYTTQPNPSQVFLGGTNFPVPAVDFTKISTDFANLKSTAKSGGLYYAPSGSGYLGYHIILKTNDTFDIYKVSDTTSSCWSGSSWQDTDGIDSETPVATGVPFPGNGVIFVEDKLWIEGQINGAALTVAAAQIGANQNQYKSIIINHDFKYTNKDGSDKLGLIAQNNVSIGLYSDGDFSGTTEQQNLEVDAAMIAQNGRVGRNYFDQGCDSTYYQRNTITVYGSVTTNQRYGFAWICGNTWDKGDPCDSGYQTRNLIYDQNTALSPPPFFPTTGTYTILDWREE